MIGPARVGGDVQPDILYPMDMEDMLNQIQVLWLFKSKSTS
jgi:hypothetical protein